MNSELIILRDVLTADEFLLLRELCELGAIGRESLETSLRHSVFTLSAILDNQLIGMLRVVGDHAFIFLIYDVMIRPEYRRQGFGRRLVLHALTEIERMALPGQWVGVNLFASPGREAFYERLGFVTLPNEKLGPGMQLFLKGK